MALNKELIPNHFQHQLRGQFILNGFHYSVKYQKQEPPDRKLMEWKTEIKESSSKLLPLLDAVC